MASSQLCHNNQLILYLPKQIISTWCLEAGLTFWRKEKALTPHLPTEVLSLERLPHVSSACIRLLHTHFQGSVTLWSFIYGSWVRPSRSEWRLPFKSAKPTEKVLCLCWAGSTSGASAACTKLCNKVIWRDELTTSHTTGVPRQQLTVVCCENLNMVHF